METANEMRAKIVDKATNDPEFRARLLSDPKGTIGQELGVTIPASMSVEVHEESAEAAHLVLPPTDKLNESDLQAVAGGIDTQRIMGIFSDPEHYHPEHYDPAGRFSG